MRGPFFDYSTYDNSGILIIKSSLDTAVDELTAGHDPENTKDPRTKLAKLYQETFQPFNAIAALDAETGTLALTYQPETFNGIKKIISTLPESELRQEALRLVEELSQLINSDN